MKLYAGLDTSCYATSIAFLGVEGKLAWEGKRPLYIQKGNRGLKQSEMIFQHINNLPILWEEAKKTLGDFQLESLTYSSSPRPQPESYMPVFRVAEAFGKCIAFASGSMMISSTHQEGHIAAGCWSSGIKSKRFLAVHLSGGTSEILLINDKEGSYEIEIVGGTKDLNAGQFIDRIGVAMGLPFPAGPFLEKKAQELKGKPAVVPVSCKESWFSFSGPSTFSEKMVANNASLPSIARGVEVCVGETLARAIKHLTDSINPPVDNLLVVGGVAANQTIRKIITKHLSKIAISFPKPIYAGDNAVGLAYLGFLAKQQ